MSDHEWFDTGHLSAEKRDEFIPHTILISQNVAASAKHLNADAIFSFDEWYRKIGLMLADDLIAARKTGCPGYLVRPFLKEAVYTHVFSLFYLKGLSRAHLII